jgi:cell filamentation protein, protein adenylyltransferase
MTVVSKNIDGKSYYYFQDRARKNNKYVTTYIGTIEEVDQDNFKPSISFVKHMRSLYKADFFINDDGDFEKYIPSPIMLGVLRITKSLYQMLKNNLPRLKISEIEKDLLERYVHSTTTIEGYTLNLTETKNLLSESQLTPAGKPYPHSTAVINYKEVEKYISTYHRELTEKFILQLHSHIMNNLNEGPIGEYKKTDKRGIHGVDHPRWQDIPKEIEELIQWYYEQQNIHPIETASIFHERFEEIHPFWDGNGRTGRAILDFMLRRHGFPTIFIEIIIKNERDDYIQALQAGNKRHANYVPIIEFIIHRVIETLMWVFTKSPPILETIISSELKELIVEQESEEVYDGFIEMLNTYRERQATRN